MAEEIHWSASCRGDGEGIAVAMFYRKLPWQWIKGEQIWIANGIDCEGRCMFGWGRIWRFYPGKTYEGTVSYFDCAGFMTTIQSMITEGFLPDMPEEELKELDPTLLPDDVMVDKRTLEQIAEKCCPPQIAMYNFEGVEF
jgi:hypothetical protein